MQKQLTRIFSAGFALVWGWVFLNSVLRWQHNGLAALAAGAVLGAVLFALARFVLPLLDQLPRRRFRLPRRSPKASAPRTKPPAACTRGTPARD